MNKQITLKEIAEETRKELKDKFPGYKFSVTIKGFSGGQELTVALMSGPTSPFADAFVYDSWQKHNRSEDYAQLNDKYIENYSERPFEHNPGNSETRPAGWYSNGVRLTAEAAKMLEQVVKIANRHNWDNSDIQTDYFDVNYYFHLEIGKWNKPYSIA